MKNLDVDERKKVALKSREFCFWERGYEKCGFWGWKLCLNFVGTWSDFEGDVGDGFWENASTWVRKVWVWENGVFGGNGACDRRVDREISHPDLYTTSTSEKFAFYFMIF